MPDVRRRRRPRRVHPGQARPHLPGQPGQHVGEGLRRHRPSGRVELGTFPVTDGSATVDLTVPRPRSRPTPRSPWSPTRPAPPSARPPSPPWSRATADPITYGTTGAVHVTVDPAAGHRRGDGARRHPSAGIRDAQRWERHRDARGDRAEAGQPRPDRALRGRPQQPRRVDGGEREGRQGDPGPDGRPSRRRRSARRPHPAERDREALGSRATRCTARSSCGPAAGSTSPPWPTAYATVQLQPYRSTGAKHGRGVTYLGNDPPTSRSPRPSRSASAADPPVPPGIALIPLKGPAPCLHLGRFSLP